MMPWCHVITADACRYRFDVVTSDVRGAGTEAAVLLELQGPGQAAGPWVLDKPGAFGRGQVQSQAQPSTTMFQVHARVCMCTYEPITLIECVRTSPLMKHFT